MKNVLKKALVVLLAVTLLIPATVASAAPSPAKKDIKKAKVTVSSKTYTYNGKKQTPKVTVKVNGTKLTEGKDYKVSGAKNAGKHKVTITGIGKYTGKIEAKDTFTIKKATQKKFKVTAPKPIKASSLKKKAKNFEITNGIKGNAKVTFESKNKNISVSNKGILTLKKGLKKGKYEITVYTKATKNYKQSAKKKITIQVK